MILGRLILAYWTTPWIGRVHNTAILPLFPFWRIRNQLKASCVYVQPVFLLLVSQTACSITNHCYSSAPPSPAIQS